MADAYIPKFGTKDPDDVEDKNFDIAPLLLSLGSASPSLVVSATVVPAGDDGALVITNVAWSPSAQRVSFRWSGGTLGAIYLVTCRITMSDGRQFDQSAYVTIAQH